MPKRKFRPVPERDALLKIALTLGDADPVGPETFVRMFRSVFSREPTEADHRVGLLTLLRREAKRVKTPRPYTRPDLSKSPEERLTARLEVRMTAGECEDVAKAAAKARQSISAFCRAAIVQRVAEILGDSLANGQHKPKRR